MMNLKRVLALLAGLAFLWMTPFAAQAAGKGKMAKEPQNRIVFQVSDNEPARWNLVLNNVKNLQKELGADNVKIEVVAYGPGINMFKIDSEVGSRLQEAADSGVKLAACGNTMKGAKLTMADMHPAVSQVPAGIVELMRKQQEGWAYIRP